MHVARHASARRARRDGACAARAAAAGKSPAGFCDRLGASVPQAGAAAAGQHGRALAAEFAGPRPMPHDLRRRRHRRAEGTIAPEGGCPGKFFTSRKWIYEHRPA